MNSIIWSRKAVKQARRIPVQAFQRIVVRVEELADFPDTRLDVKKLQAQDAYRLRVGTFRVIFTHDDVLRIIGIEEVKKRDERTY